MSSRALRRLQGDSGIGIIFHEDEEKEDQESSTIAEENGIVKNVKNKKKKGRAVNVPLNPFELLNNGLDEIENLSDKSDSDGNVEKVSVDVKKVSKPKKKKKSRKKEKESKDDSEDIEASIQEVNRILGDANLSYMHTEKDESSNMKPLVRIDYRNFNPETELMRIFGSQVVRGEQGHDRFRRQRNRPVQRSSKLVQPKEGWHPTGGSGLTMKYLGEGKGFVFEHSPAYQKIQFEFLDAVESGHPEAITNVLRKQPYHIDSLMQISDFHRINEDFQVAAEFIEKALYGMECAFHTRFNIAAGMCHLPYNRPENRPFHLCVFKHIMHLGRRGCNRTAFEFCKLLLGLDPLEDPLDCMMMIDYYALRSEQYEFLLQLEKEVLINDSRHIHVPNFAFSVALAHFKDAFKRGCDTNTADYWIQDALIFFPVMLIPLLDQCSVQPDKRVSSHPFFNSKELLDGNSEIGRTVMMYVKRCEPCWKEVEVMNWLERNVLLVLDIVDTGTDKRIKEYAELRKKGFKAPPLTLLRHYFLSEIPGVAPPQRFTTGPVMGYDPFPPPNTALSYTRPSRAPAALHDGPGIIRSFVDSLRPSYNPNDPVERNARLEDGDREEGAVGGDRPMNEQIRDSVNAIMNALGQIVDNPFGLNPQEIFHAGEQVNNEEGEQDDRHDQRE